ncbi:MAG TPA: phosphoribosyltransferase family protein [Acidimicrobiales bacterium]|nr:phosphoribosyltransferase family protein [Acidimicrobiales bacterium]
MRFRDRLDAGRHLAEALVRTDLRTRKVVVAALPRGGVPVAFEVAERLGAPLDVLVVRKLGVPFQPELAMGAIGEGGVLVANPDVLRSAGLGSKDLEEAERRERPELEHRAALYREGRSRADVRGRCVIVVDDGIATGSSVRAACHVVRALGAARIVVAVPVASRMAVTDLRSECDDLVCLEAPDPFFAVGEWYRDFSQTRDDEVIGLLRRSALNQERAARFGQDATAPGRDEEVEIPAGEIALPGRLTVPLGVNGVVLFAHGSGSGRHSPRNRSVAAVLQQAGLATLLLDLLTPAEALDHSSVFDVPLLAARLGVASQWVTVVPELGALPIGYFGASTGAAAALWSAAQPDSPVAAVVSRGGRPDLAGTLLPAVTAPTLLIVGGRDEAVLELNRTAQAALRCQNDLVVVPGATHLFEEPDALDTVAGLARDWFLARLSSETQ